jgi:uncharacterized membrane-anchored protein
MPLRVVVAFCAGVGLALGAAITLLAALLTLQDMVDDPCERSAAYCSGDGPLWGSLAVLTAAVAAGLAGFGSYGFLHYAARRRWRRWTRPATAAGLALVPLAMFLWLLYADAEGLFY